MTEAFRILFDVDKSRDGSDCFLPQVVLCGSDN